MTPKQKNDGWAFVPEDGRPPRLVRFVPGVHFYNNMLVLYLHEQNRILVNKDHYDALDAIDQGRALATHVDLYANVRDGRVTIE